MKTQISRCSKAHEKIYQGWFSFADSDVCLNQKHCEYKVQDPLNDDPSQVDDDLLKSNAKVYHHY
nr:EH domain-containing protein 1-like [Ipomoea batatas]